MLQMISSQEVNIKITFNIGAKHKKLCKFQGSLKKIYKLTALDQPAGT